jgi:hypothetical protein
MHTDNEWTSTDLGLESSNACSNNLPTKLQMWSKKKDARNYVEYQIEGNALRPEKSW